MMINPDYTHLPTSFERFRCELNRKKSKFECNRLVSTIELIPGLYRLDFLVLGVPVIDHFGFFEIRHFNPS